MEWSRPVTLPGQYTPKSAVLPTLRLAQLCDLARAYEIPVYFEGTKEQVLPVMEAEEAKGTFNIAPKHPYYFERAKFNSDAVKEAKSKGGWDSANRRVTILDPWMGPNPDSYDNAMAEKRKPTTKPWREANRDNLAGFRALKDRARALGIKVAARSKESILKEIEIREGRRARDPEDTEQPAASPA